MNTERSCFRLFQNEEGAVSALVAIFIGLFGLGFIALTIDTGILQIRRSEMITAADSAALAGAITLRECIVEGDEADSPEVISEAMLTARNYAIENGSAGDYVHVQVSTRPIVLANGETDNRQVVEVQAGVAEPALFSQIWGDERHIVRASAMSTWGFSDSEIDGSKISAGDQAIPVPDEDTETSLYVALIR